MSGNIFELLTFDSWIKLVIRCPTCVIIFALSDLTADINNERPGLFIHALIVFFRLSVSASEQLTHDVSGLLSGN